MFLEERNTFWENLFFAEDNTRSMEDYGMIQTGVSMFSISQNLLPLTSYDRYEHQIWVQSHQFWSISFNQKPWPRPGIRQILHQINLREICFPQLKVALRDSQTANLSSVTSISKQKTLSPDLGPQNSIKTNLLRDKNDFKDVLKQWGENIERLNELSVLRITTITHKHTYFNFRWLTVIWRNCFIDSGFSKLGVHYNFAK